VRDLLTFQANTAGSTTKAEYWVNESRRFS